DRRRPRAFPPAAPRSASCDRSSEGGARVGRRLDAASTHLSDLEIGERVIARLHAQTVREAAGAGVDARAAVDVEQLDVRQQVASRAAQRLLNGCGGYGVGG